MEQIKIPQDFLQKMQQLLGEEYQAFLEGYCKENHQGLRVNTQKTTPQWLEAQNVFSLRPIEWSSCGFYYEKEDRPGKHPYHEAGVYYIQEPSAMAVAELTDPQPGERVLDLCAAPGGKTTGLAAKMQGKGLLVANEIVPSRAKILAQNVERMGAANVMVTNEDSARLAQRFSGFFHRIVVDAPCSGEGMFRKNPIACTEWSLENVAMCAKRQMEILRNAQTMLRPGGVLVYSTCTFSPEENEQVISQFLKEFPEYQVVERPGFSMFDHGRIQWGDGNDQVAHTYRLWPHHLEGEGHFAAVLKKDENAPALEEFSSSGEYLDLEKGKEREQLKDYVQFVKDTLTEDLPGKYIRFGDVLYLVSEELPSLKGLKVVRPGLPLGSFKKNRFEPAHALALALAGDQVKRVCNLSSQDPKIFAYLRGESLEWDGEKGWYQIQVDGFPIGWGKMAGGMIKNHFPKGLRWTGTTALMNEE